MCMNLVVFRRIDINKNTANVCEGTLPPILLRPFTPIPGKSTDAAVRTQILPNPRASSPRPRPIRVLPCLGPCRWTPTQYCGLTASMTCAATYYLNFRHFFADANYFIVFVSVFLSAITLPGNEYQSIVCCTIFFLLLFFFYYQGNTIP